MTREIRARGAVPAVLRMLEAEIAPAQLEATAAPEDHARIARAMDALLDSLAAWVSSGSRKDARLATSAYYRAVGAWRRGEADVGDVCNKQPARLERVAH